MLCFYLTVLYESRGPGAGEVRPRVCVWEGVVCVCANYKCVFRTALRMASDGWGTHYLGSHECDRMNCLPLLLHLLLLDSGETPVRCASILLAVRSDSPARSFDCLTCSRRAWLLPSCSNQSLCELCQLPPCVALESGQRNTSRGRVYNLWGHRVISLKNWTKAKEKN